MPYARWTELLTQLTKYPKSATAGGRQLSPILFQGSLLPRRMDNTLFTGQKLLRNNSSL